MIRLVNLTREPLTPTVPHVAMCSDDRCFCTRVSVVAQDHNPLTGDAALRLRSQRAPYVVSLWALSTSEELPDSAALAPDIVKLVRARKVRIDDVGDLAEAGEVLAAPRDIDAAEVAAIETEKAGRKATRTKER